jgi:hypothetical protein
MRLATPMRVPTESKSASRKNTSVTPMSDGVSAPMMSSLRNVGAIDGGLATMP